MSQNQNNVAAQQQNNVAALLAQARQNAQAQAPARKGRANNLPNQNYCARYVASPETKRKLRALPEKLQRWLTGLLPAPHWQLPKAIGERCGVPRGGQHALNTALFAAGYVTRHETLGWALTPAGVELQQALLAELGADDAPENTPETAPAPVTGLPTGAPIIYDAPTLVADDSVTTAQAIAALDANKPAA